MLFKRLNHIILQEFSQNDKNNLLHDEHISNDSVTHAPDFGLAKQPQLVIADGESAIKLFGADQPTPESPDAQMGNKDTQKQILVFPDDNSLPKCWNTKQRNEFCRKYPWLIIKNGKLGCSHCREVSLLKKYKSSLTIKQITPAQQWAKVEVEEYGKDKLIQQVSLRKKIRDHVNSKSHQTTADLIQKVKSKDFDLDKYAANKQKKFQLTTERVFRTVYNLVKNCRPYKDLPSNIDMQKLNGCDMGTIIHSKTTCAKIADFIGVEMRSILLIEIVQSNAKFGIILDESTSLSQISSIAIYLRVIIKGAELPVNMFLQLVELNDLSAKSICDKVLTTLSHGIQESNLQQSLIGVTCDGASVMLGRIKDVAELLKQHYPNLVIWHCSVHRLELCVGDTMKELNQINHFKVFIEKLHSLYTTNPKNQRELKECANNLDVELLKIGKILSTRWVASSLRTVRAVWENYAALFAHCKKSESDRKHDGNDRAVYGGCARLLSSVEFVKNLGLMYDVLCELSELSLEPQKRDISIIEAHHNINIQISVFEARVDKPGRFESEALNAAGKSKFTGVTLHESGGRNRGAATVIPRAQFYRSLQNNLRKRMFTVRSSLVGRSAVDSQVDESAYELLVEQIKVLFPIYWNDNIGILYGENEVVALCDRFRLNNEAVVRSFRKYKQSKGKVIGAELNDLLMCIKCIPISSAECERAFSAMNLIITDLRSSLGIERVSNFMFILLNGPPLSLFNPSRYVRSWLAKGNHAATDINSVVRKEETYASKLVVWKLFN